MTKRMRLGLLLLPGIAILTLSSASASDVTDPIAYKIHAVYKDPQAQLHEVTVDSLEVKPELVDMTGDSVPDILVQMTIDAGRATLRVSKLPDSLEDFPLSVEAILQDPRKDIPLPLLGPPDDKLRVAFGYDALNSTAPQVYDATLAIAGADRVTSFSMDLHTVVPGDTLGVTGSVYTLGDNGEHIDPIQARIDFTPVPAVGHFGILSGSDIGPGIGAGQASIDLASDIPTTGVVVIEDIQGTHENRVDATVDKIPNTMSLVLTGVAATGQQTWNYRASDRVDEILIKETETRTSTVLNQSILELQDMSLTATLVQDSPTHSTFQSDSAIGVVRAGLAKGGAPKFLGDDQYLYAFNDGTVESLAFQVKQLESAEVGSGDPFVIGATLKSGPFHLLQVDGAATTEGWFLNLPHTVKISGSPSAGTISYEGSAVMGKLTLDQHNPAGVSGRATDMHLLMQDIPTTLDLAFGGSSSSVSLDAKGQTLGLIELQLTSGPDDRIDEAYDGVLVEDLADKYVVFSRITGLKKVVATSGDDLGLRLDTAAGRVFKVSFDTLNSNNHEATLDATLDHLVPSIEIHFNAAAGTVTYTGSDVMDLATLDAFDPDGISGRATTAHLRLESIPTSLSLSFGRGGTAATIDAGGSTLGLFQVQLTSGPDDQIDPGKDGILVEDLTDKYVVFTRVTGLRKVVVDQGPPPALTLNTTGGREFVVDLEQDKPTGRASTTADINVLPASLSIKFTSSTNFNYTASDPVGSITLDSFDPDGVAGGGAWVTKTKHLNASFTSLPHGFDVSFATDGTVTLDAHGEKIGQIEFLIASCSGGPSTCVDDHTTYISDAQDGIMLLDLADRYEAFFRTTGLYTASAKAPNLAIDSDAGRVLKVETEQLNTSGKTEYLRITLDRLVRHINVSLADVAVPGGTKSVTTYNADVRTNSLSMDSNSGDRWNIHTGIAPLPVHLDICSSGNTFACSNRPASDTRSQTSGPSSTSVHASENVTINVFDCQRPLNATCIDTSSGTKYFQISNWRVKFFEQENAGSDSAGMIWENTSEHGTNGCAASPQAADSGACHNRILGGSIKQRDTSAGTGIEQTFGNGSFWADQRQGGWTVYIFSCCKKNYINCDSASLNVWLLNIKIGVSGFIC
ncbi:MAG: hypothetical protein LC750_03215 [Actinobacteria bacterium]|nr:hypothetical protein [Actinomycetota bacterium]